MTYSINKKNKTKRGYAILELLFYIALFTVLSLVVINAMILMTRSFKETSIYSELLQSGSIMEKISREIRQANGISSTSSATDLILNTKNDAGVDKTEEFKFVSPDVQFWDNGASIGNLNSPNIVVSDVTFTQITTVRGKAVRIVFSVRSGNDASARVQDFYDTVVLRGSY